MFQRKAIFLLIILAFALRLVIIFGARTYLNPYIDEFEQIANNILAGKGYSVTYGGITYRNYEEPLYVWITVLTYFLSNHSHLAMLIVQVLFSVILIVLVYLIAKEIFNPNVAFLSALLVCFHPGLTYFCISKLEYTGFTAMLTALSVLTTLNLYKSKDVKSALYFGLVFGIGILSRNSIFIFLVCSLLWLLFNRILKLNFFLLIMASVFLTISPLIIRNYKVYHKIILFKSNAIAFWYGNNENSMGTGHTLGGKNMIESAPASFKNRFFTMNEVDQEKFLYDEAKKFILSHPKIAIELFIKKIYYFWWFPPFAGMYYPHFFFDVYKLYYLLIVFFTVVGLIYVFLNGGINKSTKCKCGLLLLYFLGLTLIHAVYYVEGRHRWAIESLILIFTSSGIIALNRGFLKLVRNLK